MDCCTVLPRRCVALAHPAGGVQVCVSEAANVRALWVDLRGRLRRHPS
jgi:hypothetical protein